MGTHLGFSSIPIGIARVGNWGERVVPATTKTPYARARAWSLLRPHIQDCVLWNTYRKTATLRLANKWISEFNTIIGAIAPARRADMSPMKPSAHTTVSKVMPINAENAAFLRVMPGVYTLSLPSPHLPNGIFCAEIIARWQEATCDAALATCSAPCRVPGQTHAGPRTASRRSRPITQRFRRIFFSCCGIASKPLPSDPSRCPPFDIVRNR